MENSNFREHCTHSEPQKTALAGHRDDRKSSPEQLLEVSSAPLSRKKTPSCGEVSVFGNRRDTGHRFVCPFGSVILSCSPKPWSHHLTKDIFETNALYSLLAVALASSCGGPCAPQVRSSTVHCECSVHGNSQFPPKST